LKQINLKCKKTENCFADSQTYEYRLPVTVPDFLNFLVLDKNWEIRRNDRLRRPVFIAEQNGIHIKGILAGTTIRVSFPEKSQEQEKEKFENWLVSELEKI
jgi:hypothetical protein